MHIAHTGKTLPYCSRNLSETDESHTKLNSVSKPRPIGIVSITAYTAITIRCILSRYFTAT